LDKNQVPITMNVRHSLAVLSFCWAFWGLSGGQLAWAQATVFPGDANNNGRVDHYDVLPIGYAFGHYGPARIQTESTLTPQGIPQEWTQHFATGVNYVHADADGDGLVSMLDLALVGRNFGLELDSVQRLDFSSTDDPGGARVSLNGDTELPPFVEGTTVDIPLRFELPADDPTRINGIAFSLDYEAEHFADVQLFLSPDWLLQDGGGISLVRHEAGKVHLALTRFGPQPIGGSGDIGILRMIIIDDLVSLLEAPADTLQSDLQLIDIQAYDGDYALVPVGCPELAVRMYCESATGLEQPRTNPLGARLFPNPVYSHLQVLSEQPFTEVELVSGTGQARTLYRGPELKDWQVWGGDWPPGFYCLRLRGPEGQSLLKFIQH
jgi:hypothetical protein